MPELEDEFVDTVEVQVDKVQLQQEPARNFEVVEVVQSQLALVNSVAGEQPKSSGPTPNPALALHWNSS